MSHDPKQVVADIRAADDDAARLEIERKALTPTVFPEDADEAPSLFHRLLHRKVT
jgi:hypothetical protein